MAVEDGDEGVMVGDDGEVHASEEYVAFVAHETANSSCSMITYRDLALERNRDPACTMSQASACCCWRMKPSPWQLASVHRRVGLVGSKYARVAADVREALAALKTCSKSSDQTNSFLVRRSGHRGDSSVAMVAVAVGWCREVSDGLNDQWIHTAALRGQG